MSTKLQLTLDYDKDLEAELRLRLISFVDFRILSRSLDARGANRNKRPRYIYQVELIEKGETFSAYRESFTNLGPFKERPLIIGAGPAGLFCALRFSEYGIPCTIIERGDRANERMKHIARFWRYGEFDSENNVCFGEGGAGLFSDGKLITRIKSPYIQYVMNRLVDFGAPPEIAYESNPHLGSNKIRGLISKMTEYLKEKKFDIRYNTRVDKLLFDEEGKRISGVLLNNGSKLYSNHVILATGHSASDIYRHLKEMNIGMKGKDFAVGVRIEHRREDIDKIQHGLFAGDPLLGTARYRLSWHNPDTNRGSYSFCMCPGGYVLSSGTDSGGIVVNGMSNFSQRSPWSNSAIVVSVKNGIDFSSEDVLSGVSFQKSIERLAYESSMEKASGKEIPAQNLKNFLDGSEKVFKLPKTSCPSGIFYENLDRILPNFVTEHLRRALFQFEKKMKGFSTGDALLLAPETRTSAPVTLLRDRESLVSDTHHGLYPCGEGAGYAGGITSAAVDGVKVAMSIIKSEKGHSLE